MNSSIKIAIIDEKFFMKFEPNILDDAMGKNIIIIFIRNLFADNDLECILYARFGVYDIGYSI